jgi:beta-galactosidase
MGHINFAQYLIDRKGITDRVTLDGMTLMNWQTYNLPLDDGFVKNLTMGGKVGKMHTLGDGKVRKMRTSGAGDAPRDSHEDGRSSAGGLTRPGIFFKGSFLLDSTADTYIDMSGFRKGIVWVNGHNLGRYWYVGPQQHLYCPASWLKKGKNEVVVMDLQQTQAAAIRGVTTLD